MNCKHFVSNMLVTCFSQTSRSLLLLSLRKLNWGKSQSYIPPSSIIMVRFQKPELRLVLAEVRPKPMFLFICPRNRTFVCTKRNSSKKHLILIWIFRSGSAPPAACAAVTILHLQGRRDNSLLHPHDCRKCFYSSPRHPQLAYSQDPALVNNTAHTVGYIFQPTKAEFRLPVTQSNSFRMWSWGHRGQWKDSVRLQGIQPLGTQERFILLFFSKKQHINHLLL